MSKQAKNAQNAPKTPSGVSEPGLPPSERFAKASRPVAKGVKPAGQPRSAVRTLAAKLDQGNRPAVDRPERKSFEEFLLTDARVPDATRPGEYTGYSFEGREAVRLIVRRIDAVIGSDGREPIVDARCGVAGGAQWGKTILELNFAAYATAQRFLRMGLFLPDDKLVEGVVDTKLRPDVIDQIPWFAEMCQVGKAVNKSGKTVQRKGAFMVTDGVKRSYGMVLGLQKIPTTFTVDVAAQDEVDDIPEKTAKFVKGRMTASPLRFALQIGTQRIAGRGMNREWKEGSQGVILLGPVGDDAAFGSRDVMGFAPEEPEGWINPEDHFPQIVRRQLGAEPSIDDPQLTWSGAFEREGGEENWAYERGETYYLAHPETGEPLNRFHPLGYHRVPAKLGAEDWTLRISQLSIGAIPVSQIVQQFCEGPKAAVNSPDAMVVFRCDVLALPQSTAQALTPAIIERAQTLEPFSIRLTREANRPAYGGLDVGDQCWFFVRERESALRKRASFAAKIPVGDMVRRAVSLFHTIGLAALFIDQRPEVSSARSIALELNGLASLTNWPQVPKSGSHDAWIALPSGLTWDGRNQRWRNLRCAVVRFDTKRLGGGITHGFDEFDEGGFTKFVPLINVNRFETIDRVVREILTPAEGIVDVVDGQIRETPALLLPRKDAGATAADPIAATIEAHLVTGSEREKDKNGDLGEYVDGCANHLLLADGYSALAELECGENRATAAFEFDAATDDDDGWSAPVRGELGNRRGGRC